MMICPSCKSSLVILELEQVETDVCLSCGGIWLDAGELDLLSDSGWETALAEIHKHHEESLKCPVCNKKMGKVTDGQVPGVIIDKCREGHGYWFEKDELRDYLKSKSNSNPLVSYLNTLFQFPKNGGAK